ncbi:MAG: histidine--tRNA ligase [Caldisericia bacterium]|nr:histidine--tRNA ligase [Caldisericia bacterium]
MKYKRVKGTRDILPDEWLIKDYIEGVVKETAYAFGYREITTPILEDTGLFIHSVGDSSDIVTKEMYTLQDKGGRDLVMIPEGTAGVCRAYLENKMTVWPKPVKLFYLQRLFRYERPQKGRYREFSQFGVECFGSKNPLADAEIISLANTILKNLKFDSLELHINSLGCPTCRKDYREALVTHFSENKQHLCEDCQDRLSKNPLRILDCKVRSCRPYIDDTPKMKDYLCEECKTHFNQVLELLASMDISFVVDDKLVRGLDYYSRTVFEIISKDLGAQGTVLGGGRYDGLIHRELDGPETPSMGFAMGIERITMLLQNKVEELDLRNPNPDIYISNFGGETAMLSLKIAQDLRQNGVKVWVDLESKGMKKVFDLAEKRKASYLLVLGEDELKTGKCSIRRLSDRTDFNVELQKISLFFDKE